MVKTFYLSLCFVCVTGVLASLSEVKAQSVGGASVSGTVTSEQNEPVKDANVVLKNKKTKFKDKGTTGTNGEYEFSNLDAGKYKLTVKKSGYSNGKKSFKLKDGREKTVDITLKTKENGGGSGSGNGGGSGGGSGSGSGG
ncbi:exported protein [Candidatus Kuenenia stuttgartiensis]|jgi:uncharacterized membrane protein|uniref:Exported protein n=1 Tax=Kuenenia stuttgartiensis TaxID=174633 RepID=Q1Q6M3_KUEST|nr:MULTISPECIES: carboxypeptidase-like regulatory domain-containing protein [Kuenenia]MBE7548441.1 carboxypeptidase regulatory-like domain-containing protein [Planctomycetia bacterium]MCF6151648.1 carboxypeptidase regulatory-like domain-containing protein [Candidatus Kuenenia stuttgartiensis]MCL4726632.1 MSCRAMM family adhesin SdrC [Candidatus Kuenenia stuttgartiensis]MCZ7620902.1 carboxypeptidase-like regulatory domain-containing protein [Candidatus Kuenenia sp.]QII12977.1 exported protein [C